jgi:hypothetical protein
MSLFSEWNADPVLPQKGLLMCYILMLTDPLTEDEVNSLFGVLEREVVPLHHELQIG